MSRTSPPPESVSWPTLPDLFLLLAGCAASFLLLRWEPPSTSPLGPLRVEPNESVPEPARRLVTALPELVRLPEGVTLLWPVFYVVQKLRARARGLTAGEWLLGFSWLGTTAMTGLTACAAADVLPGPLREQAPRAMVIWYLVLVPSLALFAFLVALVGLGRRRPLPWTHNLSLALLLWPALPLGGALALGTFVSQP